MERTFYVAKMVSERDFCHEFELLFEDRQKKDKNFGIFSQFIALLCSLNNCTHSHPQNNIRAKQLAGRKPRKNKIRRYRKQFTL